MAGRAVHLGRIVQRAAASPGEHVVQLVQVVHVQVPCHPDAIPSCNALRRALGPVPERPRIVAVGAVYPQRLREVDHQRIRPVRLLDRRRIRAGQCHRGLDTDIGIPLEEGRERIVRKGRVTHRPGGDVLPGLRFRHADGMCHTGVVEPDLGGHRVAAMAGVASHSGGRDVRLVVRIDVLDHLDHAPGHDLGVDAVVRHVRRVVAVGAALRRGDPVGDRDHQPGKLADAETAQHLHVFIDRTRLRSDRWQLR